MHERGAATDLTPSPYQPNKSVAVPSPERRLEDTPLSDRQRQR
jgi:hypothetical protein